MGTPALRVGHLSTFYHASSILMTSEELERDLGQPCEWTLFGTGPEMVRAFQRGELDVGYMGLPPAIIGIAGGVPIKCVAAGHVEGTVMVSREPVNIPGPLGPEAILKSFSGKVIGTTSKGSIHDVILTHYLAKHGLAEEIHVRHHDQAEYMGIGLASREIDACVGTPALYVFSKTLGPAYLAIPPSMFWPGNPSYGLFFHEPLATENPRAARVFASHHARAVSFIRDRAAEAAEQIARTVQVADAGFIEEVLRVSPRYFSELTSEFIGTTMAFAQELGALGYINQVPHEHDVFLELNTIGTR